MKKLQNTLYITTPDAYLSLDGENVVMSVDREIRGQRPLHLLESIVIFGYPGASPALLGKCAEMGIMVTFLTPQGKFLSRCVGKTYGNVIVRRTQYRIADDSEKALHIARNMISAKLSNSAAVLRRVLSDHRERVDDIKIEQAAKQIKDGAVTAYSAESADTLRGLEGECANRYFSVFDEMILQQKDFFTFDRRNRRPPMDPVNAMLSFGYALMTSICTSALETAGLDPYVGFFHTERPGRCSLALDLLEEFRAPFVDRFVLTMINKKIVTDASFTQKESGAVLLTDDARRDFLDQWQKKKYEEIQHPYLKEQVQWGMIPFVQAALLAKYIRGDLDDYPPFIWK
ncbi:MAG: type I-C CRISPR-associated endonuclease Cas1 [Clostridia bacterium]|nr:type I-C CRISPR-associated endonuclease Cas1 [Clostridia bacterium]